MFNDTPTLAYPKLKLALLALLTVNTALYAIVDSWYSAIDAAAWLILLVMFELESLNDSFPFSGKSLHAIRNGLIAIVTLAFVNYVLDGDWPDVANSLLWFALIALLELEVRRPEKVRHHPLAFWLATIAVFVGLLGMVGVWLWQSAWLDAYDAALWIAAFATIEIDIFRFFQGKLRPASPRGGRLVSPETGSNPRPHHDA